MARIRVCVPTYRRVFLLERALKSLLDQTYQDWIAVVRNDDPDDARPRELVEKLADERIVHVNHQRNLGPLETFNAIYREADGCEFLALLEDDNAWEPDFLNRMLSELDSCSELGMVWCNQWLDRERSDGSIEALKGRTVRMRNTPQWLETGDYAFGHPAQATGALHANGAMLLRSNFAVQMITPPGIPFTGVEHYRERLFKGVMRYVSEPLARFTITKTTARHSEDVKWARFQAAYLATYLLVRKDKWDDILGAVRRDNPRSINTYISACAPVPELKSCLKDIRVVEWMRWLRGLVRRPYTTAASMGFLRESWWNALLDATIQKHMSEPKIDAEATAGAAFK